MDLIQSALDKVKSRKYQKIFFMNFGAFFASLDTFEVKNLLAFHANLNNVLEYYMLIGVSFSQNRQKLLSPTV